MIRGALILGIGFSLGYAKALHDSEDIKAKLTQILDFAKEASARNTSEDHTEAPDAPVAPADAISADAIEVSPDTPPATEGE